MAVLLQDNFDRANSTSVVGAPQIGPTPTVLLGTAGINSNQLYASVQPMTMQWELGTANVELTVTVRDNHGSLILGVVDVNTYWQAHFELTIGVTIFQKFAAGSHTVYVSTVRPPVTGSVCKFHHKDGIIRAYVDGTLVFRWVLDTPITATKHGARFTSTASRFDDLLGEDAPTITEPVKDGDVHADTLTYLGAEAPGMPGFAYRGRDSKIQDELAGA
jgi:hypothetical protein